MENKIIIIILGIIIITFIFIIIYISTKITNDYLDTIYFPVTAGHSVDSSPLSNEPNEEDGNIAIGQGVFGKQSEGGEEK